MNASFWKQLGVGVLAVGEFACNLLVWTVAGLVIACLLGMCILAYFADYFFDTSELEEEPDNAEQKTTSAQSTDSQAAAS